MALVEAVGSCENELQNVGKSLCRRAEAILERKRVTGRWSKAVARFYSSTSPRKAAVVA